MIRTTFRPSSAAVSTASSEWKSAASTAGIYLRAGSVAGEI
jgi:hypothetical protein